MSADKNVLWSVFGLEFGCLCGKMKLPDVIQPQPIHPQVPPPNNRKSNSTSYTSTQDTTSTTFSLNIDTSPPGSDSDSEHDPAATEVEVTLRWESLSSSAIGGSVAIAKESDDPYKDFRDSMLRMILEKGIYSRDGLKDLLRCFLGLNSPCYHEVIIQAFSEIWHGFVSDHQKTHHPKINGLGGLWRCTPCEGIEFSQYLVQLFLSKSCYI